MTKEKQSVGGRSRRRFIGRGSRDLNSPLQYMVRFGYLFWINVHDSLGLFVIVSDDVKSMMCLRGIIISLGYCAHNY